MNKLAYQESIHTNVDAFIQKVKEISTWLGINPNWLMVVMAIETARTFKASATNPYTNACGLIQFMPLTLKPWKITPDQMRVKSEVDQLDYVKKYLAPYKGKMKSFTDCYLAVFYPAAIGKPEAYEFGATPFMKKKIADQNPAYDWNKDHEVTKAEVTKAISKFVPKGFEDEF